MSGQTVEDCDWKICDKVRVIIMEYHYISSQTGNIYGYIIFVKNMAMSRVYSHFVLRSVDTNLKHVMKILSPLNRIQILSCLQQYE